MKKWLIGLSLVVLLATSMVSLAQESPVFCGELTAADCTLLKDSAAVMETVKSTTFTMETTLQINNIPDAPVENVQFGLNATGSFAGGQASQVNATPSGANMGALFKAMAEAMREMKGAMTISLDLPSELAKLTGEVKLPKTLRLDFRMVDGMAYVNLAQIAAIDPKLGVPKGWVGIDVAELYGSILPGQFAGATAGGFDIMGMVSEFSKPEVLGKFAHIERLADAEAGGQKVAVFRTTIDYEAMLNIDAFREMLESIMTTQGVESEGVANVIDMMRQIYKGMTIEVSESIGLEDKWVHQTEMTFAWDMSGMPGIQVDPAPQMTMYMVITTSGINQDFAVNVPEDVLLLPLQSMLPKQ